MGFCIGASAQKDLKKNLKKHVYTLADDSLMGRPVGTKYMKIAEDYVINELQNAGLKVVQIPIEYNHTNINTDTVITPRAIVVIVEGNDETLKNEWLIVKTDFQGYECDTIDDMVENCNMANTATSGTAAIIELAKIFSKEHSCKRSIAFAITNEGIIGTFDYDWEYEYMPHLLEALIDEDDIKIMFDISRIGNSDSTAQAYFNSKEITNFDDIIRPFKKKDNGFIEYKGSSEYIISAIPTPIIELCEHNGGYSAVDWDKPEYLKYDTMTEIVKHIKNFIQTFANTEKINIDYNKLEPTEFIIIDDRDKRTLNE
jgi:hypothetical protein